MLSFRTLIASLLLAGLAFAADTAGVRDAANLVEQKAALAPKAQALEFRLLAAQALQPRYPDLARRFIDATLQELRANQDLAAGPALRRALTALAPQEAAAVLPPLPPRTSVAPAAVLPPPPPGTSATPAATPRPTPPGASATPAAAPRPTPPPELAAILKSMDQMRGLPTDADRAKLVLQLVAAIRASPPSIPKIIPISSLANLVTEGDLGKEALNAVASTFALALTETHGGADNYIQLARLVRYEHLKPLPADPSLDAAAAVLALHDRLLQETGFTLTSLDGKTYSLDALRGKVVLLNFWATWCPPCRREMPDMEKLYQRFAQKGLVVLAVSDEKRETVEGFLKDKNYTFPVLLDPDRKVNTAFGVEGIPQSFLFDRQGKLSAQSIDMRTERQFLEMFKAVGLE